MDGCRIGKHLAVSTNEVEKIGEIRISEREDALENDLPYPTHPSNPTHPTLTLYHCYHNGCDFHTDNKLDYENMIARHWQQKHTGIPKLYPTKTELEKYGLQAQGKEWEI